LGPGYVYVSIGLQMPNILSMAYKATYVGRRILACMRAYDAPCQLLCQLVFLSGCVLEAVDIYSFVSSKFTSISFQCSLQQYYFISFFFSENVESWFDDSHIHDDANS
jgi:hypothetical protein